MEKPHLPAFNTGKNNWHKDPPKWREKRLTPSAHAAGLLLSAAGAGDLQFVRSLMQRGADPNTTDKNGWTLLMYAAERGHTETAR